MNDIQTRKFNMGSKSLEGFDDNNAIWTANVAATAKRDQLASDLADILEADGDQQQTSTGGEATDKDVAKHQLTSDANIIALAVAGFALDNHNTSLYNQFHKSEAAIYRLKDADFIAFCNQLRTAAAANIGALSAWNIINTMVSQFQTKIDDFNDIVALPEETKGYHHVATLNVGTAMTSMFNTLHWLDIFVGTLRVSQPDFYNAWQTWRKTNDSGVRHISIRGLVKASDSGNFLYKAKITITNLPVPRITFSGKKGDYKFLSLNPGDYSLKVELEGYQTLIIPVASVQEGKILDLNITLVKV